MIPISNAIKADFHNNVRQTCSLKTLLTDNTTIYITEANLVRGGLVIDRYVSSNKLTLGGAKCNEMRVTINNSDSSYDDIVFEGAIIDVTIGVGTSNTRFCTFYVDKVTKKQSIIELYCLDKLVLLDEEIPDNTFFIQSGTTLCTIEQLITKVRTIINVYSGSTISSFPNYNYQLTSNPYVKGMTYRQVLLWCCEVMGCWCYLGYDGQIYFSDSTTSSVADIKPNDRFSSNFLEDTLVIGGITNKKNGVVTTYPSSASYTLSIESNPLIALDDAATILENIYNDSEIFSGGLEYRPFTAMCKPLLEIEPCDKVTFYRKDGTTFDSYVTHIRYTINRNMLIESSGISSSQDDYEVAPASYVTNDQLADSGSESNKIVTTITEDTIKTTNVIAENLQVRVANILGTITANAILVKDNNNYVIFSADADSHTVTFANFYVEKNVFYSNDLQTGIYNQEDTSDTDFLKNSLLTGNNTALAIWAGASESGNVKPKDATFAVLVDGSVYMSAAAITGGYIVISDGLTKKYYTAIAAGSGSNTPIVLRSPQYPTSGSGYPYPLLLPIIQFRSQAQDWYICVSFSDATHASLTIKNALPSGTPQNYDFIYI